MKRIDLYVGGTRYIIEECEGRAELRHSGQARAEAHPEATAYVGHHGAEIPVELKVELVE